MSGPPPALPPGRYQGRIKTFNSKHGFGFIDCPPAYDQWKRDVFIHKRQVGDLHVGDDITFEIKTNKDGRPQAREVRRMDGSMPGPYPGGDSSDDEGDRRGGGGGGGGKGGKGGGGRRRGGKGGGKGDKGGGKGDKGGNGGGDD